MAFSGSISMAFAPWRCPVARSFRDVAIVFSGVERFLAGCTVAACWSDRWRLDWGISVRERRTATFEIAGSKAELDSAAAAPALERIDWSRRVR